MSKTPITDKNEVKFSSLCGDDMWISSKIARKLESELSQYREAVENFQNVKGRHNTQIACERLLALLEEPK